VESDDVSMCVLRGSFRFIEACRLVDIYYAERFSSRTFISGAPIFSGVVAVLEEDAGPDSGRTRRGCGLRARCRIAFCLSLKEQGIPSEKHDSQGMEFNRYTLTGEWDSFYLALLKTRLIRDGLDPNKDLLFNFKEHIERGVILLFNRVKQFKDLATLAD
jgi:DNA sulfur modification protein DndE